MPFYRVMKERFGISPKIILKKIQMYKKIHGHQLSMPEFALDRSKKRWKCRKGTKGKKRKRVERYSEPGFMVASRWDL